MQDILDNPPAGQIDQQAIVTPGAGARRDGCDLNPASAAGGNIQPTGIIPALARLGGGGQRCPERLAVHLGNTCLQKAAGGIDIGQRQSQCLGRIGAEVAGQAGGAARDAELEKDPGQILGDHFKQGIMSLQAGVGRHSAIGLQQQGGQAGQAFERTPYLLF